MIIPGMFLPSKTLVGVCRLSFTSQNIVRYASLSSAIERGIRKSRPQDLREPSYSKGRDRNSASADYRKPSRGRYSATPDARNAAYSRDGQPHRRKPVEHEDRQDTGRYQRRDAVAYDEDEFIKTGNFRSTGRRDDNFNTEDYDDRRRLSRSRYPPSDASLNPVRSRPPGNRRRKPGDKTHRITNETPERVKVNVTVPSSIPYTTPASEFIYGASAVEAALRCSRRKLYKLYIYQAAGTDLSETKITLRKLALANNIPVKMAFGDWERLMDKMSAGRPHNGCVLEASPLPHLPVKHFQRVASLDEDYFQVALGAQSREEAEVNGVDSRIPIQRFTSPFSSSTSTSTSPREAEATHDQQSTKRYPVVLMLDGILDPGNLGAIIRSAYYLGVDAIIFGGRNSAPISPVTIKSSGGAAENMTMLNVSNEVAFIQESKANGWRFYAADAPGLDASYVDINASDGDGAGTDTVTETAAGPSSLTRSPSVLMMGSEGTGLASHIRAHADAIVSIPGARISAEFGVVSDPARVDSLNVSVAAALLMQMFLRVPLAVTDVVMKTPRK